jgi:hypothetical protein
MEETHDSPKTSKFSSPTPLLTNELRMPLPFVPILSTNPNHMSDKNSLFNRGSIGEMGLWVKKNKSQYMGVLGYPVAQGI